MKILSILFFVFSLSSEAKVYELDQSASKVGFEIFKFKISAPVNGEFKSFEGSFDYDEKSSTLKNVKATIKATSVDTAEAKRDEHLRSADFFDVANYENITFESTAPVQLGKDGKGKLKGKFSLHGVSKEITLDVKLTDKKELTFEAKTKIDRKDYGIKWNKTFNAADLSKNVLGDEVKIELKVVSKK